MANMSYCRFENTLSDFKDCLDHLWDKDLSPQENKCRHQLIRLAWVMAEDFLDDENNLDDKMIEGLQKNEQ